MKGEWEEGETNQQQWHSFKVADEKHGTWKTQLTLAEADVCSLVSG